MKVLICGYGEIGRSFGKLLSKSEHKFEVYDPYLDGGINPESSEFDVIHICFGYNEKFLRNLYSVCSMFKSKYIIIESTIKIFCMDEFKADRIMIYSPCRGTHPDIDKYLVVMEKQAAPIFPSDIESFLVPYYKSIGINCIVTKKYNELILSKLVDTTWYGLQIAFANQIKKICDENDLDFNIVYTKSMQISRIGKEYKMVNGRAVATKFIPRPIMIPGKIGGHCVMPNLSLLPDKNNALNTLISWIRMMEDIK